MKRVHKPKSEHGRYRILERVLWQCGIMFELTPLDNHGVLVSDAHTDTDIVTHYEPINKYIYDGEGDPYAIAGDLVRKFAERKASHGR